MTVPVAQLLLQELTTQVLRQLVAIVAALLAAPQPGVAKGARELSHHLPQRQLLAEEGHFFVGDAAAGLQPDAGNTAEAVAQVGERRRLESAGHLTGEAGI